MGIWHPWIFTKVRSDCPPNIKLPHPPNIKYSHCVVCDFLLEVFNIRGVGGFNIRGRGLVTLQCFGFRNCKAKAMPADSGW